MCTKAKTLITLGRTLSGVKPHKLMVYSYLIPLAWPLLVCIVCHPLGSKRWSLVIWKVR